MSDRELTQKEWGYAVRAAEAAALKFGVDPEEVLGGVGEWIAGSWDEIEAWRERDDGFAIYRGALRHAATDAARGLMLAEKGADPQSAHLYTHAQLRSLLLHALDEEWWRQPATGMSEGPKGTSDPRAATNWQDAIIDVRDAFFSLNAHGQETVRHGLAVAWDWEKLGERLGCGSEAARKRVQYQLDRMREFLGGPEARIHGQWAGSRNMPEYNSDAARRERAQVNEQMWG